MRHSFLGAVGARMTSWGFPLAPVRRLAGPVRGPERGFGTAESVVGAALSLLVILGALTLTRGVLDLGNSVSVDGERGLAACWALDRICGELQLAGVGVGPALAGAGVDPSCPDEAIEFFTDSAIGFRGDLDGDQPGRWDQPESELVGRYPAVATGNDEVVFYLLRAGSRGGRDRALFEADLDSEDRVTLEDGTLLARRDGLVERIDAGPMARVEDVGPGCRYPSGTLYRVTFLHDARRAGSGRFRSVQPLVDKVSRFRVLGFDASGERIDGCGGLDSAQARGCRKRVRRIVLEISVEGSARVLRREITPQGLGERW